MCASLAEAASPAEGELAAARDNLGTTFHPKVWIFVDNGASAAFVVISNLSAAALGAGVEWNMRVEPEFEVAQERLVLAGAVAGQASSRRSSWEPSFNE